jgi:hypothetical protein
MNKPEPQFSRITATAESLGDAALEKHQFVEKSVLLTGDEEVLATENGRLCFLDSIRLLMRMVRRLTIGLHPASSLNNDVKSLIENISYGSSPVIQSVDDINLGNFDAILSVGIKGNADLPFTVINSNGWACRVSSKGQSLPTDCSQWNPIGALAAACLGVAEVFKRLIKLKPERGNLHELLTFSFYSYSIEDNAGPVLPKSISTDLLIVGAGAIGNGTIHLLDSLGATGKISIVDKQKYGIENWGTCILVGPQDFSLPKAIAAEKCFPHGNAKGFFETIQDFKKRCGKELDYPRLIICGLDEFAPRREVQDFWPDKIIDGAIGATSCEVTLHPWGPDLSCLKCDFEDPPIRAEKLQQQATGLRIERLADLSAVVTDEDILHAPRDKKDFLKANKGKEFCSIVSEAVIAMLSDESQQNGFQPSVPFVACLSSCMVVAELVRYAQMDTNVLETGFQFDAMVGPQNGQRKSHSRKANCVCVERKTNIETLRNQRFLGT